MVAQDSVGHETQVELHKEATALVRPRYSGGISLEEASRPGGKLMGMLVMRANELGITLRDMAAELKVGYSYLHMLRNGDRKTSSVSLEFAQECARFLGVPRAAVLLAAGALDPKDCGDAGGSNESAVDRALRFLLGDPEHGAFLSPQVVSLSIATKYGLIRLYEAATGAKLLKGEVGRGGLLGSTEGSRECAAFMGVSPQEAQRPGGRLLSMLVLRASERGLSLREMASQLGVGYSYLHMLRTGSRRVDMVSVEFLQACAVFLGLPRPAVWAAAGVLQPVDFFCSPEEAEREVGLAVRALLDDPALGVCLIPDEIQALDLASKYALARMYQRVSKAAWLGSAVELPVLAEQFQQVDKALGRA